MLYFSYLCFYIHIHVIFFIFMLFYIHIHDIFFIFMYLYSHSCYIFYIHVFMFTFMLYFHVHGYVVHGSVHSYSWFIFTARENLDAPLHIQFSLPKSFLTIPNNAFWSRVPLWTSLAFISNFQMASCPRSRAPFAIILHYKIDG